MGELNFGVGIFQSELDPRPTSFPPTTHFQQRATHDSTSVSQSPNQKFSFKHFIIDDIKYQLNFSIYVATGCHSYATLIKTDIQLIAFNRVVYREIQLIALMLMTSSKAGAPEMRMINRDYY